MSRIRAAIVENVEIEANRTVACLQKYSKDKGIEVEYTIFTNGFDFLENNPIDFDVVYMDIDMPMMDGMEVSKKLREKSNSINIIFVTNLPQYAISGYKVNALDFLLKPLSYADFCLATDKVFNTISRDSGYITLTTKKSIRKISADEIEYIEMVNHDVVIHMTNEEPLIFRGTIKSLEKNINSSYLQKCNSGYIVNITKVKSIQKDVIVTDSGANLIISRTHRKNVLDIISNYIMGQKI